MATTLVRPLTFPLWEGPSDELSRFSEVGMVAFRIPNMRCGGCARSVTAALRGVAPASEIRVDMERHEVTVEGGADADALAFALRQAGFKGERLAA
ncbi:heavy-metal-associated domain-containing protein [Paeniroseomonas aquatica]